jgi:3-oxoadipate enol-lactonase
VTDNDKWVDHDGLRFRCRINGPGAGKPWIVFSNSLLTDLTLWDVQAEALSDHYNILRYDQRGHGGTSVPAEPCTFEQLGSDALALIEHFEIGKCTFVGLSMGIPTALWIYERQPDRIARLVLCDGQAATAPTGAQTWKERIETARAVGMAEVARQTCERWFSEEFMASGRAAKAEEIIRSMALEGYVACARALQAYDFRRVLAEIAVPTLLMAGANDGTMPTTMSQLAEAIPGAVMKIIPDAGHIPNFEQPEIFNRHLLAFVA